MPLRRISKESFEPFVQDNCLLILDGKAGSHVKKARAAY